MQRYEKSSTSCRYGGFFCDTLGDSVFTRCHAALLFKQTREVLGVLEAELVCNLIESQFLVQHVLLREVDDLVLDVALCRHARFFFDEITEVAGREEQFLP